MRFFKRGHKGFTLIEMVVVIGVMGVLAAVAVPLVANYVGESQERGYDSDAEAIQTAVEGYYTAADNTRYAGQRQYPVLGMDKTTGTFIEPDVDSDAAVIVGGIDGNPWGGTRGGSPVWVDDGNLTRDSGEEDLNDEDTESTVAGWHVVAVTRGGTTYYVDTRDYFIDFDELVSAGYLKSIPGSASASGSYGWYMDADGRVQTLLSSLPTSTSTGYQDTYP